MQKWSGNYIPEYKPNIHQQRDIAAKTINYISLVEINFPNPGKQPFYFALLRPHLQCNIQFWALHLQKDSENPSAEKDNKDNEGTGNLSQKRLRQH